MLLFFKYFSHWLIYWILNIYQYLYILIATRNRFSMNSEWTEKRKTFPRSRIECFCYSRWNFRSSLRGAKSDKWDHFRVNINNELFFQIIWVFLSLYSELFSYVEVYSAASLLIWAVFSVFQQYLVLFWSYSISLSLIQ
jgi:hypothetical protein